MLLRRVADDGNLSMVSSSSYKLKTHKAHHEQSQPIHHFWDRTETGKCANSDLVQIVPGAINCVLDFFIIMLVGHPARSGAPY